MNFNMVTLNTEEPEFVAHAEAVVLAACKKAELMRSASDQIWQAGCNDELDVVIDEDLRRDLAIAAGDWPQGNIIIPDLEAVADAAILRSPSSIGLGKQIIHRIADSGREAHNLRPLVWGRLPPLIASP